MATLVITDLAPGRTAVLQLYTRGTNTTAGSAITGTSSGSTYSFAGVPDTGDYDALLSGFSTPNAARFPIRNAVAYTEDPWDLIDATVFVPAVTAETPANTCSVVIRARQAGSGKQVRVLIVSLGSSGRFDDKAFVNRTIDENTDVTGLLVAQLPWSSIPGIGKYRVRLIDIETGEVLHDRVCTVPDEEELDYEDLPTTVSAATTDTPGSFLIRELDGSPSSSISTLVVSNGSLTISGGTGTLTVPQITSGTDAPSGGNDGDIYLQYAP